MLNTKDWVFKKWPVRKLVDWYVGSYIIDKVVSTNIVKLWLPTLMKIHPVIHISWIIWYREQIKRQKIEKVKPVEVERVEEWEMENFLNKIKIREVVKYLV